MNIDEVKQKVLDRIEKAVAEDVLKLAQAYSELVRVEGYEIANEHNRFALKCERDHFEANHADERQPGLFDEDDDVLEERARHAGGH